MQICRDMSFPSKVWYCETQASHGIWSHGWCWQGSTFSRALCWSGRWNVGETWDATFHEGFWFRKTYETNLGGMCEGTCSGQKNAFARKALSTNFAVNVLQMTGRCFQDQAECPDDWFWGSGCSSRVVCFSMFSKRKDCKLQIAILYMISFIKFYKYSPYPIIICKYVLSQRIVRFLFKTVAAVGHTSSSILPCYSWTHGDCLGVLLQRRVTSWSRRQEATWSTIPFQGDTGDTNVL